MPSKRDPDWEIVEELPGERKRPAKPRGFLALLKNKMLWIGVLAGVGAVLLFPVVRAIFLNLVRAWWLWLGLALYWIYRRMQRANTRR